MKKEWILTEKEKELIKNKVISKRIIQQKRKKELEVESLMNQRISVSQGSRKPQSKAKMLLKEKLLRKQSQNDPELDDNFTISSDDIEEALKLASDLDPFSDHLLEDLDDIFESLETSTEPTDYLISCLKSCDFEPELIIFDPAIFPSNLPPELGFPSRDLILPEKFLIENLVSACSVLVNPYKAIRYFDDVYPKSARISPHFFKRLKQMCESLNSFSGLNNSFDKELMIKTGSLEMMTLRFVLMYDPDREAWGFIDVSKEFLGPTVPSNRGSKILPGQYPNEHPHTTASISILQYATSLSKLAPSAKSLPRGMET